MYDNKNVRLQSPQQIVSQIDHMQKEELDQILAQLERENRALQAEYDRFVDVSEHELQNNADYAAIWAWAE